MPHTLPEQELRAWLALMRTPGLGGVRLKALVAAAGSACAALARGPKGWRECGVHLADGVRPHAVDGARIAADLEWLAAPARHFVPFHCADYPPLLARCDDAPATMFVHGDPTLLWCAQVAIVGSRSASAGGLANARELARALTQAGLLVTSGLADGIDGAAHAAALDADGATIAVCGTGLERTYPRKHRALAARIVQRGALVSEYPLDTPGVPDHFPRRNRIISGLSLGTLVVEAGVQSGSLITARLAAEQGREVFAIPGSIHNPTARGCHRLIRAGAKLVECAQDVLDELGPLAREAGAHIALRLAHAARDERRTRAQPRARDPAHAKLFAALGHDPVAIDVLAARTGLTAAALSSMLQLLELDGEVAAHAGARYARAR